jgi:hypothetical protein
MKPEGPLLCSQESATGVCPEPAESSTKNNFRKIHFNVIGFASYKYFRTTVMHCSCVHEEVARRLLSVVCLSSLFCLSLR